ncbi:peptide ABC transporter substrate-binding protein [Sporosarcina sp. P26b]|uniref:ABC transporter ATP-binding protein n=1 Tax=Sporosarcina TaxID=1569 RepID=UPI000A17C505|nr:MULTISPECIES: oligopeptide/dipeptide ABC transporter ATP-binding protein [Sporosarcina]ARK22003.1 peptide ABC transporter substrate-binding protein [Sporosarcina ureae]PIC73641.1 peptide ABC transporter substrate-binding protein [Sporosarcina sp. P17b]PIC96316.1 peptide ABC transporter substrate-binding protein [Sporosarcina sp. P26b]
MTNIQTVPLIDKKVLLEVKNLKKHFEVPDGLRSKKTLKAVDGIDFTVIEGETLGIVGESGCGKSTTGNLLIHLLEKTEGTIVFNGQDMDSLNTEQFRKMRADIQMIFQDPFSSLNPRMRVNDIIAEPLKTHKKLSRKQLRDEVYQLMDAVGLDRSYARRYPHEFSGGQRQRIGIARAIALRPKLIICDEPVSALDVSIQAQVLNLLISLQKEFNLTFIFIAHGLPAVKYISDRIAVMYLGKIVEITTKDKLFNRPMHPYTVSLVSAVPLPDPFSRDTRERIILEGDMPSNVDLPSGCRFHTRCPFAQDKCKVDEPALIERETNHLVACHFPLNVENIISN